MQGSLKSIAGAVFACLLLAACGDVPARSARSFAPTSPAMSENAATIEYSTFFFNLNILPPAPCLGEGARVSISGPITGWYQVVSGPTGHVAYTEVGDFSNVTATWNGMTWAAGPGAHEIWSESWVPLGDAARVLIHNGETRLFLTSGSGPDLRFVHRIQRVRLPSGETVLNSVEAQVYCVGQ